MAGMKPDDRARQYRPCKICGTECRGTYCKDCYQRHNPANHDSSFYADETQCEAAPAGIVCPRCGATRDTPGKNCKDIARYLWVGHKTEGGRQIAMTGVKVLEHASWGTEYVCMECGATWDSDDAAAMKG